LEEGVKIIMREKRSAESGIELIEYTLSLAWFFYINCEIMNLVILFSSKISDYQSKNFYKNNNIFIRIRQFNGVIFHA